ncbi:MAG: tetratricopeptide repeat protein [Planctomycetota bacterium]|nr:tetratricopeptide repeat protein [Planctomycetota bacterium]
MAPIDPNQFVELVEPLLAQQDLSGLLELLKSKWHSQQIRDLLRSPHSDAKKVALLALALVGPTCCVEDLSIQLKDPDPVLNQLAEHALWAVWFRGGKTADANQAVCHGSQALSDRDFPGAIRLFNKAIASDPDYAEAYNQRAIAYYLIEDYEKSIADCRRTIRRMPCHFGAWSGMGHCHAHLNQISEAIESYEKALSINPHLECVRETVDELRKRI